MGRPSIELDFDEMHEAAMRGLSQKEMAEEFGVSLPTMAKKIEKIKREQGILIQYRTLQSLELTKLQSKILSNITDDKIHDAPLRDLVLAFKILKDKEHVIDGKPSDIKGLVSYLVHLEKEEAALENPEVLEVEAREITGCESKRVSSNEVNQNPESDDFVPPFSIDDVVGDEVYMEEFE